ncbi:MAG: AraC family transcriptional regulator [Verrucomicrobia bacterium]|nr:AraC family transcriptional regulator [Verrucomicrobiota bacterium]
MTSQPRSATSTNPPVYQAGATTYHIDDCAPQLEAIRERRVQFRGYSNGFYPGDPIDAETLPSLSSIGYIDTVGWQEWGVHPHRNEGVEFCFLESGATVFGLGRKQYDLGPGALTISRPWQRHRLGDPRIGHSRLHWVIIDVGVRCSGQDWTWPAWVVLSNEDRAELTQLLRKNRRPVIASSADVKHCFREIAQAMNSPQPSRFSRIAVHLNHLLLSILELLRTGRTANETVARRRDTVRTFLKRLADDPEELSQPWTLEQMADSCGLRTTAFVKYCHDATNESPINYLLQARTKHAAALLRSEPKRTITDIALTCGFASSQYFATTFRRLHGCTPTVYRRSA